MRQTMLKHRLGRFRQREPEAIHHNPLGIQMSMQKTIQIFRRILERCAGQALKALQCKLRAHSDQPSGLLIQSGEQFGKLYGVPGFPWLEQIQNRSHRSTERLG